MSRSHALLRFVRQLHLYIGVFIAPALIFFAVTGALQTFGLHESHPGSQYKPPQWIATLAQIHKKQTPVVPQHRNAPHPGEQPAAGTMGNTGQPATSPVAALQRAHHPLPMKIFFLLVSIGLFLSSVTGVYMTWKYSRHRTALVLLLLAGIIAPLILIFV